MSENKSLLTMIGVIFGATFLLITGVVAHDQGVIDHLFDFHLDTEATRDRLEREIAEEKRQEESRNEWASEMMSWMKQDN